MKTPNILLIIEGGVLQSVSICNFNSKYDRHITADGFTIALKDCDSPEDGIIEVNKEILTPGQMKQLIESIKKE